MSKFDSYHSLPLSYENCSMKNNESSTGLNDSDERIFDNYFNNPMFLSNYIPDLTSKLFFIEGNIIQTNCNENDIKFSFIQDNVFGSQNKVDWNSNDILNNDNDIRELNVNFHREILSQMDSILNHQHKLGRKKKNSGLTGKHNKYSWNNMTVKFKVYFLKILLEKINKEIIKMNLTIIIEGKEYKVEKLLEIDQNKIKNINVEEMRTFFISTLKEILSFDISQKYRNYPKNFNKLVIEKLYKENITNVTCILDKKVSKCLKYFTKDDKELLKNEEYSCLKGIEKKFEDLPRYLRKQGHEDGYIKKYKKLIRKLENIYEGKVPRKTKKDNVTKDTQL